MKSEINVLLEGRAEDVIFKFFCLRVLVGLNTG